MSNIPYLVIIGNLMYAVVCTGPDIAHAIGVVNRYMRNPGMEHWSAIKWILQYLRGTTTKELCFIGSSSFLSGFVDSDLVIDVDIRSTTCYVFQYSGYYS